jgi:hypothetical protein
VFWLCVVEVEMLVAPEGAGLRGRQLQLLKDLYGGVEAGRARRLDGGESHRQPSLRSGEKVQIPKTRVYTWGPARTVASHLWSECGHRNAQKYPTWRVNCQCLENAD